jgi:hypothetical protein
MLGRHTYLTSQVLLEYLSKKSKKEGRNSFYIEEVISDMNDVKASCPEIHLLDPQAHIFQCLDLLWNPFSLLDYDLKKVRISPLVMHSDKSRQIPASCRNYIQKVWGV